MNKQLSVERAFKEAKIFADNDQYSSAEQIYLALFSFDAHRATARRRFAKMLRLQFLKQEYKRIAEDKNTLHKTRSSNEAIQSVYQYKNPFFLGRLGYRHASKAQYEEAIVSYMRIRDFRPYDIRNLLNLANCYYDIGAYEKTAEVLRKLLSFQANCSEAHLLLGHCLKDMFHLKAAIKSYDKAISLDETGVQAHFFKGMCLLMLGDYRNGWQLYEHRWSLDGEDIVAPDIDKPYWTPLGGQRVLVWQEQGLGDEIMYSSQIIDLARVVKQVIFQVDDRLINLMKRSLPSNVQVVSKRQRIDEHSFDAHISTVSLAKYFRIDDHDFDAASSGYLKVNSAKTMSLRKEIGAASTQRVCGLNWKSGSRKDGEKRSIPLMDLVTGLNAQNFQFVNLQYGDVEQEIRLVEQELNTRIVTIEHVDNYKDIDGLAHLIDACDVVVSVDNSTAHLAGAIGKETHLILPFRSEWRWHPDTSRSKWYNSCKLYRNSPLNSWEDVIADVSANLQEA